MVFSSHLFLFYFLPCALLAYYLMPQRGRHLVLTLFSYLFYGWANPLFVVLMFVSTLIDYVCGLIIAGIGPFSSSTAIEALPRHGKRSTARKLALTASIISNLSLLGFFKYFNFTLDNYNYMLAVFGFENFQMDGFFRIVLPLGISFYTFQSMSYSIDVFRGDAKVIRNFTDFACYVAMFPQLVAGPIIRFQEVADQLEKRRHNIELFSRGIAFFCLGFAKKVLLANPCGKIADVCFNSSGTSTLEAWYGVCAYAFQIYFDFSGYSDMAIGLGLMLGFIFAKNFDSPYHSKSITEFWRRWHLSLSFWLRDYLYIPLGGNRKGELRTYANLLAVMLLGGLWHGASWNFLIWGGIHGSLLGFERLQGKDSLYRKMPDFMKVVLTFVIVLFTWVFFRAETLGAAVKYCQTMLGMVLVPPSASLIGGLVFKPYYLVCFVIAGIAVWLFPQTWNFTRKINLPKAIFILLIFWISIMALSSQSYNPFIYFIF